MRKFGKFKWSFLLGLIGIVLAAMAVVSLIKAFGGSGTSLAAPGQTVVTISKVGDYTVWNETKTTLDGQFVTFSEDLPTGTTITIAKEPDGTPVPLRISGTTRMSVNGREKVSVGQATFPRPGKYKVVVSGLDKKRVLSLDESKFFKTFVNVLAYGFGAFVFLFAAVALGIYAAVRLSKQGAEENERLRGPPVIR